MIGIFKSAHYHFVQNLNVAQINIKKNANVYMLKLASALKYESLLSLNVSDDENANQKKERVHILLFK